MKNSINKGMEINLFFTLLHSIRISYKSFNSTHGAKELVRYKPLGCDNFYCIMIKYKN